MMEIFSTYPLYALIISNAVLVFGASVAMLRFERQLRRSRSLTDAQAATSVQDKSEPNAVLAGFLEHRLALLHRHLDDLAKKIAPAVPTQPAELPFDYAVRMAQHGASANELTRICGLNKAEAQLMWRLHAKQREVPVPSAH